MIHKFISATDNIQFVIYMFPKDRAALNKLHVPLQPLAKGSLEETLGRFEDKFDRLSSIIEQGFANMTTALENSLATSSARSLKKLSRMTIAVESLVDAIRSQSIGEKLKEVTHEREDSVVGE